MPERTDPETCKLLALFVTCQRPQVVVEAGTYMGHAARAMADALQANRWGRLHTADPTDHGVKSTRWLQYHPVGFLEMLEEIPEVDFAFIDASGPGDPRDSSIRWPHFEAARERLRPGGIVCVHDTASDNWSDGEGGKSVNRIRDACQINLPLGKGLSIYYR